MFLIITIKDTNLEDLFTDSISVFTIVGFWTMNIKKVMAVCMELPRRRSPLAFVFEPKNLKLEAIYCSVRKWKLALKRSRGQGIRPLLSSPPPGIWQLKCSRPRVFAIHEKKKANSRGLARGWGGGGLGAGGIDWCIIYLTSLHEAWWKNNNTKSQRR